MKFRPRPFPRRCEKCGPASLAIRITADADKGIVPARENMNIPSRGGAFGPASDRPLPLREYFADSR